MFGDEVSDPLFRSIDPFLIGMYDGDTPRPVIRVVFALASERSIVKFVSQGPSVESDQPSNSSHLVRRAVPGDIPSYRG